MLVVHASLTIISQTYSWSSPAEFSTPCDFADQLRLSSTDATAVSSNLSPKHFNCRLEFVFVKSNVLVPHLLLDSSFFLSSNVYLF